MDLSTIGTVLAIVVAAGGAVAYLSASLATGRVTALRGTVDIYKQKIDAQQTQITDLMAKVAVQDTRIEALERENDELKAQRPSAEAIQAMHDLLQSHDATTQSKLHHIAELIGAPRE